MLRIPSSLFPPTHNTIYFTSSIRLSKSNYPHSTINSTTIIVKIKAHITHRNHSTSQIKSPHKQKRKELRVEATQSSDS